MDPPKRPGANTSGRTVPLKVNHFPVNISAATICHYKVQILPPLRSSQRAKCLRRAVIKDFVINSAPELFPNLSTISFFTNDSIFTESRIGLDRVHVFPHCLKYIDNTGNTCYRQFEIRLEFTERLRLSRLQDYLRSGSSLDLNERYLHGLTNSLQLALKFQSMCSPRMVTRSTYIYHIPAPGQTISLGEGADVYSGRFQSFRLNAQPALVVDHALEAFASAGYMHHVMATIYHTNIGDPLDNKCYNDFESWVEKMMVAYESDKGVWTIARCNGLSQNADELQLLYEGSLISVSQYFKRRCNVDLSFPHLPCVWLGSRKRNSFVPMELCCIMTGQHYKLNLSDAQLKRLVQLAAQPTTKRKANILDAIQLMNFPQDPVLKSFGVSVACDMIDLKGRVLDPPTLVFDNNRVKKPMNGNWDAANFVHAKNINKFGVLNLSIGASQGDINSFLKMMEAQCSIKGMLLKASDCQFVKTITKNDLPNQLRCLRKLKLDLLFIVTQNRDKEAYSIIKSIGDLELGLPTQCIQLATLRTALNVNINTRQRSGLVSNICLKVNMKLGGENHHLRDSILKPGMLILGIDVNHPPSNIGSSVVGIVASSDLGARFRCEMFFQNAGEHIEKDKLVDAVAELLRSSKLQPKQILCYRDGVGENQYARVIKEEVSAIQLACQRVFRKILPITFVLAIKRHHTRIFPTQPGDQHGRGKNVPPGTLIDQAVVHPTEHDFYLASHLPNEGTTRSTRYHVLWDDNQFSANDLHQVTYNLCHMYARCNRSVSYPAPCYYAHWVAYRGRLYIENLIKKKGSIRNVTDNDLENVISAVRMQSASMFFL